MLAAGDGKDRTLHLSDERCAAHPTMLNPRSCSSSKPKDDLYLDTLIGIKGNSSKMI